MTRWLGRGLLAIALVALAVWLWTVLFPGPDRIIRQRLNQLAKTTSFAGNESPLARLANVQHISGFFTTDVEIRVDVPGRYPQVLTGRDELTQVAMQARSVLSGLDVKFFDINVTVAPDKQSAEANLTLRAKVAGDRDVIVQELKVKLNKSEGNWRINRIETVRTLT
jgi:hypothetical protein